MRFIHKRTGETKEAFSLVLNEETGKYDVQFSPGGKVYSYQADSIELLPEEPAVPGRQILLYTYMNSCYRCAGQYPVYTYIFLAGTDTNLRYPWDKNLLNGHPQSYSQAMAHVADPTIEYYPVDVLGSNEERADLDQKLVNLYPERLKIGFSKTIGASYAMNVCPHCKAIKGQNFLYRDINAFLKELTPLDIFAQLNI